MKKKTSTNIFNIPHLHNLLQEAARNPRGMIVCFIMGDTAKCCVYIRFNQQTFSYCFAISQKFIWEMSQQGILQNILDNYLMSANYSQVLFYNNILEIWIYIPHVGSFYGIDSDRGSCRRKTVNRLPKIHHPWQSVVSLRFFSSWEKNTKELMVTKAHSHFPASL